MFERINERRQKLSLTIVVNDIYQIDTIPGHAFFDHPVKFQCGEVIWRAQVVKNITHYKVVFAVHRIAGKKNTGIFVESSNPCIPGQPQLLIYGFGNRRVYFNAVCSVRLRTVWSNYFVVDPAPLT